jgi:hypothetical protein
VEFRGRGKIPKAEVENVLNAEAETARHFGRTVQILGGATWPGGWGDMASPWFHSRIVILAFTEPRAEAKASGEWITLEHFALTVPEKRTIQILEEKYWPRQIYSSEPRDLSPGEASTWAREFVNALAIIPQSGAKDPLEHLLAAHGYTSNDGWRTGLHEQRFFDRKEWIAFLRASLLTDSSKTRLTLTGPPQAAEPQPGARQRITFPVLDANGTTRWQADLVFDEGQWKAVTARF